MNLNRKINKFFFTVKNNLFGDNKIFFVSEPINWVIEEICKELIKNLNFLNIKSSLTYSPFFLKNKILHFASINSLVIKDKIRRFHPSNKVVVSWYHILEDDSKIPLIPKINQIVDVVHTACQSTKEKLVACGFDQSKVVLIPESIDLHKFISYPFTKRAKIKKKLGLPEDKVLIGSFQKDGVGWGEGLEPKLEKGPDIFCDVIEKLAQEFNVHVVLTGPARGYVKKRLERAGVGYTHKYLQYRDEVVDYYNILDLYLITSRVEGGPKAILESWACGIPLVSTKVGMAPDAIKSGENGFLVEIDDVNNLVERSRKIFKIKSVREKIVSRGLAEVKKYDWNMVIRLYFDLIYKKML